MPLERDRESYATLKKISLYWFVEDFDAFFFLYFPVS